MTEETRSIHDGINGPMTRMMMQCVHTSLDLSVIGKEVCIPQRACRASATAVLEDSSSTSGGLYLKCSSGVPGSMQVSDRKMVLNEWRKRESYGVGPDF